MILGMEKKGMSTRKLAIVGMLGAISAVLGVTPLGFIPIGAISITTMHLPVIVGAILEGPIVGMMVGLLFGIISMVRAFMTPIPTSFIFWNPLVSIIPRMLIGLVSYYVYAFFKKSTKNEVISMGVSAFLGSMTNTVGVLGISVLIYQDRLSKALSISIEAVRATFAGIAVTNGIPEAIASVIIAVFVCKAVQKMKKSL